MKVKSFLKVMAIMLLSITMVVGTSCKKDDPIPTPTPTAYTPGFSATSAVYYDPVTGSDFMQFFFSCTTDNIQVISVQIISPAGMWNDIYDGGGVYYLMNETLTVRTQYQKLTGTWNIVLTGTVTSGTHAGESFTASSTLNVSK